MRVTAEALFDVVRRACTSRAEVCGLILGPITAPHRADTVVSLENQLAQQPSGRTAFAFDAVEHLAALRRARAAGMEQRVIFHSHHTGDARLSERDRRAASFWPETSWLVVGVCGSEAREVRIHHPMSSDVGFCEQVLSVPDAQREGLRGKFERYRVFSGTC